MGTISDICGSPTPSTLSRHTSAFRTSVPKCTPLPLLLFYKQKILDFYTISIQDSLLSFKQSKYSNKINKIESIQIDFRSQLSNSLILTIEYENGFSYLKVIVLIIFQLIFR